MMHREPRGAARVQAASTLEPLLGLADEAYEGDRNPEQRLRCLTECVELRLGGRIEHVETAQSLQTPDFTGMNRIHA